MNLKAGDKLVYKHGFNAKFQRGKEYTILRIEEPTWTYDYYIVVIENDEGEEERYNFSALDNYFDQFIPCICGCASVGSNAHSKWCSKYVGGVNLA
jgi:hypothetical protein